MRWESRMSDTMISRHGYQGKDMAFCGPVQRNRMVGHRRWGDADRLRPLQIAAAILAAILLLAAFGVAGQADYELRTLQYGPMAIEVV